MHAPGTTLPVHPSMRHPHTGAPLRALYVRRDGRVMWPVLGAAPDDPPANTGGGQGDGDNGKPPAGASPPAGGDTGDKGKQGGDKPDAKGFPENTPVAEMNADQRAAYWQHQARKHEDRSRAYHEAVGGKSADEVKKIVETAETARRQALTVDERALEDAKNQGRTAALEELGPKAVRAAFDLLLGDMPDNDKAEVIDTLDLRKFLTDDNSVDTAKVRNHVARINPAKGHRGQGPDWGQGRRGAGAPIGGSVQAVMEARRAAREQKQK